MLSLTIGTSYTTNNQSKYKLKYFNRYVQCLDISKYIQNYDGIFFMSNLNYNHTYNFKITQYKIYIFDKNIDFILCQIYVRYNKIG